MFFVLEKIVVDLFQLEGGTPRSAWRERFVGVATEHREAGNELFMHVFLRTTERLAYFPTTSIEKLQRRIKTNNVHLKTLHLDD